MWHIVRITFSYLFFILGFSWILFLNTEHLHNSRIQTHAKYSEKSAFFSFLVYFPALIFVYVFLFPFLSQPYDSLLYILFYTLHFSLTSLSRGLFHFNSWRSSSLSSKLCNTPFCGCNIVLSYSHYWRIFGSIPTYAHTYVPSRVHMCLWRGKVWL